MYSMLTSNGNGITAAPLPKKKTASVTTGEKYKEADVFKHALSQAAWYNNMDKGALRPPIEYPDGYADWTDNEKAEFAKRVARVTYHRGVTFHVDTSFKNIMLY